MKDAKVLLAAFLAIFIVFSPAVNNELLNKKMVPSPGITGQPLPSIKDKTLVGQEAPNLKMVFLNGKEVELADFKGKTVVLYFWSTWCPTCWRGMWFMNELYLKNGNPKQTVIAANIGFRDSKKKIERFISRRDLELPVAICTTDAMAQYEIKGIPAVFIIDSQGVIRYEGEGTIKEEDFREKLKEILKKEELNKQPVEAR